MFTLDMAKKNFFDPAAFKDPIAKAKNKILGGFGAHCRAIAKNSIKTKPKGVSSAPGGLPFGHDGKTRYKDFIFFFHDKARDEVVIGAVLLPRKNPAPMPGVLEKGGKIEVKLGFNGRDGVGTERQQARPHMKPAFDKTVKAHLKELISHSIVKG